MTLADRVLIEKLLDQGVTRTEIARSLGVHPTISRKLRRGSWQPEHDHANLRPYLRNKLDTRSPHERLYLGGQAQVQADARGRPSHLPYRILHDRLMNWVFASLRRG